MTSYRDLGAEHDLARRIGCSAADVAFGKAIVAGIAEQAPERLVGNEPNGANYPDDRSAEAAFADVLDVIRKEIEQ